MHKQQQPLRFNTSTWQELKYKYMVKFGLCLICRLFTPSQVGVQAFHTVGTVTGVFLKRF